MTTPRRRTFLSSPGEHLLINSDPIVLIDRFSEFVEASGLPEERLLFVPVIGTALPVAFEDEDGKPLRWATAKPEFMWHPLMWLPDSIATRFEYHPVDASGNVIADVTESESDSVWAIRVSLELQTAGIYDNETGTWLDVLSLYGMDVENPVDLARVAAWLQGEPDETLDSIDLSEMTANPEDPEWSLKAASRMADVLVPAEWAILSGGIIATFRALVENAASEEERRMAIKVLGDLAGSLLHDVPADPASGVDYIDVIAEITDDLDGPDPDVEQLGDEFVAVLEDIVFDYQPSVDALGSVLAGES